MDRAARPVLTNSGLIFGRVRHIFRQVAQAAVEVPAQAVHVGSSHVAARHVDDPGQGAAMYTGGLGNLGKFYPPSLPE